MINPTLNTLLDHRSIRQFTGEKLTAAEVETLVDAAQHAATSTFSQQYSIISVTDPKKLAILGEITGHHWLEKAGHYFLMVADQYRNEQLPRKMSGPQPTFAARINCWPAFLTPPLPPRPWSQLAKVWAWEALSWVAFLTIRYGLSHSLIYPS